MPISHHFHDSKAPQALICSVKRRYTKYLGFSFNALNILFTMPVDYSACQYSAE